MVFLQKVASKPSCKSAGGIYCSKNLPAKLQDVFYCGKTFPQKCRAFSTVVKTFLQSCWTFSTVVKPSCKSAGANSTVRVASWRIVRDVATAQAIICRKA
jgi:hypothetical protein